MDEWKYDQSKVAVIVRDLYGVKSSALIWCNNLADLLGNCMGFKYQLTDPDVWFKASTDKYGNKYYTYILVYIDHTIIVYKDPCKLIYMLVKKYTAKSSRIGDPQLYLGGDIRNVDYDDGYYWLQLFWIVMLKKLISM